MNGHIETACFHCSDEREMIYASKKDAEWILQTSDIKTYYGKLFDKKSGTSVLLLSPTKIGMAIVIGKMISDCSGDNTTVYLFLPYGLDVSGDSLEKMIFDVISSLEQNKKDVIISCLSSISKKSYEIIPDFKFNASNIGNDLAYRKVVSNSTLNQDNISLSSALNGIFQDYYTAYKYIFLAIDGQHIAHPELHSDISSQPINDWRDIKKENKKDDDDSKNSPTLPEMEKMNIKYCGLITNKVLRLLLLFVSLFSYIDINADVVDEIKKLYTYPNIIAGISIDSSVSNGNQIIFKCHIAKESNSYKNWQKSKLDNLRNDSIKHGIEAIYGQNGGNIKMDAVNLWGNLYNEDCALFVFFKAQVISDLCARISTYKLEDFYNDCNPQIQFNIYNNATKEVKMFDFTLSSHDIADAFKIEKYKGDVYDVLLQKFIMLQGIKLNQKALPTQAGYGITLDSIAIHRNTISYYSGITDLIANFISMDDMKQSIEHIQLNLSGLIDNEKLKKAKGFPLLDMRIEYEWYKTSNKQRLCSVTFAYPSLNILSVWPDSISFEEQKIDFTEEDGETNAIPICLFTPVDMGLSVNWASSNIGASSPYEYGGYYRWGMLSEDIRKMDGDEDYPYLSVSECITGNPKYDIAIKILGEYWHIPTSKEWKELCNSCVWINTTYKGIKGYKVLGPNGNAIFLPAAGFRDGNTNYYKGKLLSYWTSDIDKNNSKRARYFCHELNSPWPIIDAIPQWRGQSIRPVFAY